MKNKKSRFWTFCLSFVPGCAEMYMGFMKMGLSLMGAFWGIVFLASTLNLGPVMYLTIIAWFYSFFHARNMAHMPEEEFQGLEDQYLYDLGELKFITKSYQKIVAVLMIVLGVVFLCRSTFDMVSRYLPQAVREIFHVLTAYLPQGIVGIAIILLGFKLIQGKKVEFLEDQNYGNE